MNSTGDAARGPSRRGRARRAPPARRSAGSSASSALGDRSERERRDHAGRARRRRRVEGHLGRRAGLGGLAAEAVGPPERLVVDDERLRLRAARPRCGTASSDRRAAPDRTRSRARAPAGPSRRTCRAVDHDVAGLDDDAIVALRDRPDRARSGAPRRPARRRPARAIEPAPPSTMFSCAPPSIENSVLMLPCPRTRNSRWRNDTSFRSPVNRPRTAISNRSRPMPGRGSRTARATQATERESHSAARFAVHGASSGTLLRHPVDASICASAMRDDRERADLRDEPGVATRASAVDEEVRALRPRSCRSCTPTSSREPEDRVVLRRRATRRRGRRRAVGEVVRPDPAADAVARLEHDDRLPALGSAAGPR